MTRALARVQSALLPLSLLAALTLGGRRGRGTPALPEGPDPVPGAPGAPCGAVAPAAAPPVPIGGGSPVGPGTVADLVARLVGHRVLLSVRDRAEPLAGVLAALPDGLVLLCTDTGLVYIDRTDVTAIRLGSPARRTRRRQRRGRQPWRPHAASRRRSGAGTGPAGRDDAEDEAESEAGYETELAAEYEGVAAYTPGVVADDGSEDEGRAASGSDEEGAYDGDGGAGAGGGGSDPGGAPAHCPEPEADAGEDEEPEAGGSRDGTGGAAGPGPRILEPCGPPGAGRRCNGWQLIYVYRPR